MVDFQEEQRILERIKRYLELAQKVIDETPHVDLRKINVVEVARMIQKEELCLHTQHHASPTSVV